MLNRYFMSPRSSNILKVEFQYEEGEDVGTMVVTYSTARYAYKDVPRSVYDDLEEAYVQGESVGRALWGVRGQFEVEKLEEEDGQA